MEDTEELKPIEVDEEFKELEVGHDEAEDELGQLDEVAAVLSTIKEADAINRATAVTLESMGEDYLPEGHSVKSYTVAATKTNLVPTVESLASKILKGIQKVWEFIKKYLKKLTDWIKSLFGSKGPALSKDNASKTAEEVKDKVKETERTVKSFDREQLDAHEEKRMELIAQFAEKYQERLYNQLTIHTIADDQLKRRYDSAADALKSSHRLALQAAEAVKATLNQLPRKEEELYENSGLLKRQILGSLKQITKAGDARTDGFLTVEMQHAVVAELRDDVVKLAGEPVDRDMDDVAFIDTLVEFWTDYHDRDDILVTSDTVQAHLFDTYGVVEIADEINMRRVKLTDADILSELKEAMRMVNKYCDTLAVFQKLSLRMSTNASNISKAAMDWISDYAKELEEISKAS